MPAAELLCQGQPCLAGISVLYADANPTCLERARSFLEGRTKALHLVDSADTALLAFAKYTPDLLVMDLNLPGMGGVELIALLRGMNPDLPLMLVIDEDRPEDLVRAIEIQANGYLVKPVRQDKLIATLERIASDLQRSQELRAQRELTNMTLDSLPHPAMLIDIRNAVILTSNKVARKLGYQPGGDLQGELFACLSLTDSADTLHATDRYRGRRFPDFNCHDRFWDVAVTPVGMDIHMYYAVDVSERKRMERLREDVERIVRHDLKSPLSPIIGFSELILMDTHAPEVERYAQIINDAGNAMLDLINNSLDLYKMENGTFEPRNTRCDAKALLERLEKDFTVMAKTQRLTMEYRLNGRSPAESGPAHTRGEQRLIYSLCANLLRNAIEASPKGEVVSCHLEIGNGFTAIIHNKGAVPEAIRDRFFQMYATSGKANGTGLGTYSARLIARAYGGDVTYVTSPEDGTTLRVFIP